MVGATASEVVGQKERTGEDGEGDTSADASASAAADGEERQDIVARLTVLSANSPDRRQHLQPVRGCRLQPDRVYEHPLDHCASRHPAGAISIPLRAWRPLLTR